MVKGRHAQLRIQKIYTSSDVLCDTQGSIQNKAVSFYTALFAKEQQGDYDHILQHIPQLATTEDNLFLTRPPQTTEVKEAVCI